MVRRPTGASDDAITIDADGLAEAIGTTLAASEATTPPGGVAGPLDVPTLLRNLQSASSQASQAKLLSHACKSAVVKALAPPSTSQSQSPPSPAADDPAALRSMVAALTALYLHPRYAALRGSLEWFVEALSRPDAAVPHRTAVLEVALRTYRLAVPALSLASAGADATLEWAKSLSYAADLDKECRFLPEDDVAATDASPLVQMLTHVDAVFAACTARIDAASSAEVSRYIECCGECMRAVTTLLKTRRALVLGGAPAWVPLTDRLLACSMAVLRSDIVHKDIVTAAAMSAVCLQWAARFRAVDPATFSTPQLLARAPGHLLLAVVRLLGLSAPDDLAAYNAVTEECVAGCGLHGSVREGLVGLDALARSAVLRACMTVCDVDAMRFCPPSRDGSSHVADTYEASLLFGPLFSAAMAVCGHSLTAVRVYGLQTVEAWFSCIEMAFAAPQPPSAATVLPKLRTLSSMLIGTWSHPSKTVNHMVPVVYQRLIDVVHAALGAGTSSAVSEALWAPFVAEAIAQPSQRRARYQALSTLLPRVGAAKMLKAQPDIFDDLVHAAGALRDVSASSCSVIVALIHDTVAKDAAALPALRQLWAGPLAATLCADDAKQSGNAADYLVPELLKVDPASGPHLLAVVRALGAPTGRTVWGLVQVCLHARLLAVAGRDIVADSVEGVPDTAVAVARDPSLRRSEVTAACLSDDVDLRLAALTLLTASQRTSAPLPADELDVLKATLPYSIKCPTADQRQRLTRIVKAIVVRVSETSRIADRDGKKLEKRRAVLTKDLKALRADTALGPADRDAQVAETEEKIRTGDAEVKVLQGLVADAEDVFRWLSAELQRNLYPGTVFEREVTALELLHCALDQLELQGRTHPQPRLAACFCTVPMTTSLLNLLNSSWDRSRRLAADLLLKFPRPLPGYASQEAVQPLVEWGCKLAGSARQRESDAGALLLRALFTSYSLRLGWQARSADAPPTSAPTPVGEEVPFTFSDSTGGGGGGGGAAWPSYISALCDLLERRLETLAHLFAAFNGDGGSDAVDGASKAPPGVSTTPLCHGMLLAVRYCLSEVHVGGEGARDPAQWRAAAQRVLALALRALQTAMVVVAEAPSDVPFAPLPTASAHARAQSHNECSTWVTSAAAGAAPAAAQDLSTSVLVKGPVNTSSSMSASYMNTNGAMGRGSGDGEADGDERENTTQRAVVAAWLLVKEATATLSLLVDISPPPPPAAAADLAVPATPTAEPDAAGSDAQVSARRALKQKKHEDAVSAAAARAQHEVLSAANVATIGYVILDALGRLKHMGAIAEAHNALQAIAERLFTHGERSVDLCRLPSLWMDQLLRRLASEQQVFILRRSAGFAYSFVSLLRSEPDNCKVTLLPLAMRALLGHVTEGLRDADASPDDDEEEGGGAGRNVGGAAPAGSSWRMCVHALNVLRMILVDAALAADLDSFIAECAQRAVQGFKSPKWAVRNSSMMVFASVVQRAVDNDKNEAGGAKAATAAEFFTRFPSLFPFLLSELAGITAHAVVSDGDGWPVAVHAVAPGPAPAPPARGAVVARGHHEGGIHPALFPILLLLSKMRAAIDDPGTSTPAADPAPTTTEDGFSKRADLSLFAPLLEHCGRREPNQKVREMAAKALAALTPLQCVPTVANVLSQKLLAGLGSGKNAGNMGPIGHNEMHGLACLVAEPLATLGRRLPGLADNKLFCAARRDEVTSQLLPTLAALLAALSAVPCPPVHYVFLRALRTSGALLEGDAAAAADARALLVGQCRATLHAVLRPPTAATAAGPPPSLPPYAPVLFRECLSDLTHISVLAEATDDTAPAVDAEGPFSPHPVAPLLALLSHRLSEVREGVLMGCARAIDAGGAGRSAAVALLRDRHGLLPLLLARLQSESEPPLRILTLDVMCELARRAALGPGATRDAFVAPASWTLLTSVATSQHAGSAASASASATASLGHDESSARALEVMGWVLPAAEATTSARLSTWLMLLEEGAGEDRGLDAREAAARSLVSSGVLRWTEAAKGADEACAVAAVRGWLVALRLMQDDDEDIRAIVSVGAVAAAAPAAGTDASAGPSPVQGKVLEMMVASIGHAVAWAVRAAAPGDPWPAGLQIAVDEYTRLAGTAEDTEAVLAADGEALCSKIFEAEQANLHIEPLVAARVLSQALGRVVGDAASSAGASAAPARLRTHLLQAGVNGARVAARAAGLRWIGGGLYQKDVYAHVAAALAAALDALSVPAPHPPPAATDAELCRELRTLLAALAADGSAHPQILELAAKGCSALVNT